MLLVHRPASLTLSFSTKFLHLQEVTNRESSECAGEKFTATRKKRGSGVTEPPLRL